MIEVTPEGKEIMDKLEISEDGEPTHYSATLNQDGTVDTQDLTPDSGNDDALRFDAMAAVQAALNAEPIEFENQFKLGMATRIQDAIERKRDEAAQAIFGTQNQEVEVDDSDAKEGDQVSDDDEDNQPEE